MFDTVLVANRGEIAVRIIRACREMGLVSVAVYSDVDRLSPHVLEADKAAQIGPAPASESYLRGDHLIEVALSAGAGAIHPGYGFLAERASFAADVEKAGLVFIGPSPESIQAMGDKTEARRLMAEAGVPIIPGVLEPTSSPEEATDTARALGFPVLLKAVAGGGGKGMRVVSDAKDLPAAFEAASREAESAFGDGAIYVEKYLERPRHIEIQVLGDQSGAVVHLGERECSIQRRHQKLIEESPSPLLQAADREAMGLAAVQAARAVDYRGLGTVEFLYENGAFYFLEMNTRLQVEHPVTELVTGLDLVQWQIRVAAGEPLDFGQEDVSFSGHAIECRITSEDSDQGFLPVTGCIDRLETPSGPGVRWDGGIRAGSEIGLHYDPLLGKLIVHAASRTDAIARMKRALGELVIHGVDTSVPFHLRVMDESDFVKGDLTIAYLEDHAELLRPSDGDVRLLALVAALLEHGGWGHGGATPVKVLDGRKLSDWQTSGWPWQT
ncbi:MAG TPA: acetyl-CoA carboxylase biotin carboxylase subunit [Gemmatimonadetes bacterium]|nr:acetyl-CoA carboxylase biotin carboxylase subunit [Gemmatimonadota bacterium]